MPDPNINFQLIATQIGNELKYDTSINEINRIGQAVLEIAREEFPNQSITSVRVKTIYNWILSLAKIKMNSDDEAKRFVRFWFEIAPESEHHKILKILEDNNLPYNFLYKDNFNEFYSRNFHAGVIKHSKNLFLQGNYFHAIFESAKIYNINVKAKSISDKDGQSLMLNVWGSDSGVLKITRCITQTDKDYRDGIKFISAGLMSAIRNSTAHEPAIMWSIDKQDCLDILSLISFLYHQLDKAVYYKTPSAEDLHHVQAK
jgi:uncharacterized protein (TIGR02391 family)